MLKTPRFSLGTPYFYCIPHIFVGTPIFSLENLISSFETPKFLLETPNFHWRTHDFHWRPHFFIGDPIFSLENPRFSLETLTYHWRPQDFHLRPYKSCLCFKAETAANDLNNSEKLAFEPSVQLITDLELRI